MVGAASTSQLVGHIEVITARIAVSMANTDSSQNFLRIPDTRISLPRPRGDV
jgi:hypothetical protein